MTSHTWWWCLPAMLAVGCANSDGDIDTADRQSGLVCGMEVLPSPQTVSATACEEGRTILGPVTVTRDRGASWDTFPFEVAADGDVCVSLRGASTDDHGHHSHKRGRGHHKHRHHWHRRGKDDGKAFVWVDGDKIAKPRDFRGDGEELQLALDAGTHELKTKLVGKPGSSIQIEVREPFTQLDSNLDIVNGDGSVRLTAVGTDHPLLTPNNDGHHDDTFFSATVEPLVPLPGKDNGSVAYFLEWEFEVVDLDSCSTIDTDISGTTQINSPTRVSAPWDGRDSTGTLLPNGTYAYIFRVTVVDEFGTSFGSIDAPAYSMILDASPVEYAEVADDGGACDPALDPNACRCPGGGGVPGLTDPNCRFGMVQHLLDEGGFPPGAQANYYDPSVLDLSFISTTQDPDTGRYRVTVDLTDTAGGGLVSKGDGVWDSEAELRQWVEDMTGVPADASNSLFNFDYAQIGTSTGVNLLGRSNHTFNHFLLDAMTDDDGFITVNGTTTDLAAMFGDDALAPPEYDIDGREEDECTVSGNTDGEDELRAKTCSTNSAVTIGDATDLGIYMLRSSLFGIEYNGIGTAQDELCVINGIFSCGIRTNRVPADTLQIESTYYEVAGGAAQFARTDFVTAADIHAVSLAADRGAGEDGVCSRSVATRGGLVVRMDTADGAVPSTCVINGVIPF